MLRSISVTSCALLDHARSPYHRGRLAGATHVQAVRHPTCGDQVWLELRVVEPGLVAEAWFDGRGCLVSQAAASVLCETIEGRPLADLRELTPDAFLALLGTPLTPARRPCALLAWQAVHAILAALPGESAAGDCVADVLLAAGTQESQVPEGDNRHRGAMLTAGGSSG